MYWIRLCINQTPLSVAADVLDIPHTVSPFRLCPSRCGLESVLLIAIWWDMIHLRYEQPSAIRTYSVNPKSITSGIWRGWKGREGLKWRRWSGKELETRRYYWHSSGGWACLHIGLVLPVFGVIPAAASGASLFTHCRPS